MGTPEYVILGFLFAVALCAVVGLYWIIRRAVTAGIRSARRDR